MADQTNSRLKTILHQKAEELEKKLLDTGKNYSDTEIFNLIKELEAHQFELEMQNEELSSLMIKAEIVAEKYTKLHDFAPCGCFTITKQDEILELNFSGAALLGKERSQLLNKRFAFFVIDESKPTFFLFLEKIFESKTSQTCEIVLSSVSKKLTHSYLTGIVNDNGDQCLLTVVDVSQLKESEHALRKSKLLLHTTLESQLDTIIFSIDKEYNYLSFNKAHSDIMKQSYNADIKVGINILDYISSIEDRKVAKENYDRALSGESHTNIRIYGVEEKSTFESFFNPIVDQDNKIIGATGLARNITNHIQNENNLKISEENLQSIFDSVSEAIYVLDKSGTFIDVNKSAEKMYLYSRQELIGKTYEMVAALNANDFAEVHKISKSVFETGTPRIFQFWAVRKNGEIFPKEVMVNRGKYLGKHVLIASARDITEQIKTRNALEKSESQLIEAQAIAKVGNWDIDFNYTDINWSKEAENILGLDSTSIQSPVETFLALVHPDDSLLVQTVFVHSIKKDTINSFEHRIITPSGNERIIEQRWKIVRDKEGKPLRASGTCQDITERKNAEKLLIQSKTRFSSIINSSPVAMALHDENLNITYVNQAYYDMFGYTLEEMPTVQDWFPKAYPNPNYRKKTSKAWITALETVKQTGEDFAPMEVNISCKDGSNKTVLISANKLLHDSNSEYLVNFYDITARKQAEQELENEKRRLALILIGTGAGTWEWNINTGAVFINNRWAELIGYTLDELAPVSFETWRKYTHPDDSKYTEELLEKHFQGTLDYFETEFRMKHKNGDWIWILSRGKINEWDVDGKPLLMSGTHLNITERKEAEKAKEKALNLFHNITSHVPGVVYQYLLRPDGSSCFPYASEAITEIYQVTPKEVREDASKVFKNIHPDDYESVAASIQKSAKYLTPWKHEYRVKFNDGEVRHLYGNSNPQKLEDGSVLWHGYITDITENKITENSLRESEEKYRGLVENAPYGILIYVEDKIAFINEEGLRMVRAKNQKEVIGKSVLKFVHPDSIGNIIQRMKDVTRDNNASAIIEEKFISIDGITFEVEIKAIPTLYNHKPAVQVIVHDITERKQSALELNKINRVYALISQINNLIIRTHNREELFQEICNIAVNFGKFRMSWIGLLQEDNKIITAAFAGFEEGFFTENNATTVLDVPEGRGPTGIALREGRTVICNDIIIDPIMKPWRTDALSRGYYSSISIPLVVRNKKIGVFNLYSDEKNFFSSEEEISLLEKITLNIAFALESILTEEDRQQTEEKIRQLSQAVEQSPVTILITNTAGEIEYVNPKFVETTGYTFEEIIGQNTRFLKSDYTTAEEYKELWQTINAGREWRGEFNNKKKDGTLFWESATISPIHNTHGKTTHFIAIKENITDRKIAEQDLISAKLRAEESDRLKLAFLANMSHEIRTPMNGIIGFTELLKAPGLTGEEQQEYINIIEKSGKRMLNIINDIISISKVESGQIEVSLSETNVNEQLNYIHSFFTPEANQKGIQLSIKKQLPARYNLIKTDGEKLYAILTNLVKNAIKFTDEGTIEFGCEKKGGNIEFFVKDSGIGISNSQINIVFERFRQANESISRSHEGSGLGLAISKAYIEMIGGKIWVDSEIGKGSTFYFTLPFQSESENEDDNEYEEKIAIEKVNLKIIPEIKIKDLKVLIVEDDAISKLLITIAVKPFSKEILKVSSGMEAIEMCSTNPDIDLVMMDINMPKMGGYEATKQIREFNKDLVIIAQTANGMQSDRDEAIAAGCTDYISKPINIKDLGALIQKYFNK
ncbi:PAS domain S-box protein [Flavobacterium sp.]|uniref:PAS domain S-box protein n=1 Tax=Flavobacterium sp. TaxID=239 RepID=UPI00286E30B3|nr:PAS domain S-box protein [Flavobacterium sp.]